LVTVVQVVKIVVLGIANVVAVIEVTARLTAVVVEMITVSKDRSTYSTTQKKVDTQALITNSTFYSLYVCT